jgi:hypothetical protein
MFKLSRRFYRLGTAVVMIICSVPISACLQTQEMPLAPNVVRLDTHASGLLFTGQAAPQTLHRAAELTLQNGYTHFRLEQANMAQGSQLAGVYSSASGNAYGTASATPHLSMPTRVGSRPQSIATRQT